MSERYKGLPEFREKLSKAGYTIYPNRFSLESNSCNWLGCKPIPGLRKCELNDPKQMQLVVSPYEYIGAAEYYASVEVLLCGEYRGQWYKLQSHGISVDEFEGKINNIIESLSKAWQALGDDLSSKEALASQQGQ